MEILKSYLPENPKFFTQEQLDELGLPEILFPQAEDENGLKDAITQELPTGVKIQFTQDASRFLDSFEISELRKKYGFAVEEELPDARKDYETLKAQQKEELSTLKDIVKALETIVEDCAYKVRKRRTDIALDENKTYKWVYRQNWVYYSFINGKFRLVDVEPISENESEKLGGIFDERIDEYIDELNEISKVS